MALSGPAGPGKIVAGTELPLEGSVGPGKIVINTKCALRYMQRLGYTRAYWRKGTFFDGHDRDDVRKDRLLYLAEKLEQDKRCLHAMPTDPEIAQYMQMKPEDRPYIELVHDESACNANDSLKVQWVYKGESAKLRSKSSGAGLMTSAFIVEMLGGIMSTESAIAAETLEYGKGVWWNSSRMLSHLRVPGFPRAFSEGQKALVILRREMLSSKNKPTD